MPAAGYQTRVGSGRSSRKNDRSRRPTAYAWAGAFPGTGVYGVTSRGASDDPVVEERIGAADDGTGGGLPAVAVGATVPEAPVEPPVEQADVAPAPAAAASTPSSRFRRRILPLSGPYLTRTCPRLEG
ncbi:hypothetical protein KRMM14A1004_27020 [Krasilnikovia sp. MM14-A1004]